MSHAAWNAYIHALVGNTSSGLEGQEYPEDLPQIVARLVRRALDAKAIAVSVQTDAGERPKLSHIMSYWYDGVHDQYPPDRFPRGIWTELLRREFCVAQFEYAAEKMYPEMYNYFGGVDAFIWKGRQGAPAYYNKDGTATYHLNQEHMEACMHALEDMFPPTACGDEEGYVSGIEHDKTGFDRLMSRLGCADQERVPEFHARDPGFAHYGPDPRPILRNPRVSDSQYSRAMVYFLLQRRGPVAYVAWANPWCLVDRPADLADLLGLHPEVGPLEDQHPSCRAHLVWRLLIRRWAGHAVETFTGARGLAYHEREYERRVLASRRPLTRSDRRSPTVAPFNPHPMLYDELNRYKLTTAGQTLAIYRHNKTFEFTGCAAPTRRVLRHVDLDAGGGAFNPELAFICDDATQIDHPGSEDGDSSASFSGDDEWDGRFGEF